jgi:integrase
MSNIQEPTIIYSVTDGLRSKHTKDNYRKFFSYFLKDEQVTEVGLLAMALQNPHLAETHIINHIKRLSERGLAHGSIHTACFSIFHFFEMNDINLNKRKVMRFLPPDEGPREDRAYTHAEIADILEKTDERSRVIMLLMVSTGMRIGAIHVLQITDLVKVDAYGLYKIKVYANSPRDRYYTFCTPECAQAIDSYLQYRQRFGEVIKPSAPLIREQFNTRLRDPFRIANPRRLSEDTIASDVKQVLKRSGKVANVKQSHGMRKFAVSMMIKAKVDFDAAEYMVGHKTSRGIRVHYDRTTEEDRLQEYLKAVDLLTINPENRLNRKIHLMEAEHSVEWQALKREMDELRKFVFPGPVPRDKQLRKTYLKVVKSHYKDEKGLDIVGVDDPSNNVE